MTECLSAGRSIYRIFDKEPQGAFLVSSFDEAWAWNEKGWGIFWTVNEFNGARKKENCKRVISWAVDIDSGTKEEQWQRIESQLVMPTTVIETARGFHLYFDANEEASPENYRDISERLVEAYRGDANAKDVCRILRVPAFCHWKGESPVAIRLVYTRGKFSEPSRRKFSEKEMRILFPTAKDKAKSEATQKVQLKRELKGLGPGDLWEKVWRLNCEDALERLSGSAAVFGETYSFRRTSGGNLNLVVNGKGTSCFIDTEGRIGSLDKGGPTIFQWLNWHHRDKKKAYELLRQYFPELFK